MLKSLLLLKQLLSMLISPIHVHVFGSSVQQQNKRGENVIPQDKSLQHNEYSKLIYVD